MKPTLLKYKKILQFSLLILIIQNYLYYEYMAYDRIVAITLAIIAINMPHTNIFLVLFFILTSPFLYYLFNLSYFRLFFNII